MYDAGRSPSPRDARTADRPGSRVSVGPNDIVSCLVRNQQPTAAAAHAGQTGREQQRRDRGRRPRGRCNAAGPTRSPARPAATAVTNQSSCPPAPTTSPSRAGRRSGLCRGSLVVYRRDEFTASSVTLDADDVATCTIVNNDQPAHLTLVKTVTNLFGGTAVADRLDAERDRTDADLRRDRAAPRSPTPRSTRATTTSSSRTGRRATCPSAWSCTTSCARCSAPPQP